MRAHGAARPRVLKTLLTEPSGCHDLCSFGSRHSCDFGYPDNPDTLISPLHPHTGSLTPIDHRSLTPIDRARGPLNPRGPFVSFTLPLERRSLRPEPIPGRMESILIFPLCQEGIGRSGNLGRDLGKTNASADLAKYLQHGALHSQYIPHRPDFEERERSRLFVLNKKTTCNSSKGCNRRRSGVEAPTHKLLEAGHLHLG